MLVLYIVKEDCAGPECLSSPSPPFSASGCWSWTLRTFLLSQLPERQASGKRVLGWPLGPGQQEDPFLLGPHPSYCSPGALRPGRATRSGHPFLPQGPLRSCSGLPTSSVKVLLLMSNTGRALWQVPSRWQAACACQTPSLQRSGVQPWLGVRLSLSSDSLLSTFLYSRGERCSFTPASSEPLESSFYGF